MPTLTTAGRIALVLTLVYAGFLALVANDLPTAVFRPLFSEQGPFERMSIYMWLVLGAVLLLPAGLPARLRLAMAAVSFAFAAREADLHKAYTVMSISKIKFYLSPAVPLLQKLAGGLVLLALVVALVYLALQLWRWLRGGQALHTPVGQLLLLPVLLLPASKVIDRMASVLYEDFGITLPPMVGQFVAAFEEGMELALPVLFLAALLLHRGQWREARARG
jgi:hypothetical protein